MPAAFAALPTLRALPNQRAAHWPLLSPIRRWLGTHHLDHTRRELAVSVTAAALLAFGALVGVSWIAGYGRLAHELTAISWFWYPLAFGAEAVAYVGYAIAYRELVRIDDGHTLRLPRVMAVVSSGFGLFIPRGGFSADLRAFVDVGFRPREARLRVLALGGLEYAVLAPAASV